MNKNDANVKLKQLMQSYEQGIIDFEIYRQRRKDVIDEFAGQDDLIPPQPVSFNDSHQRGDGSHRASSASTLLTFVLVLVAVLIAFFAITDSEEKKMSETFVDSSAAPLKEQ